MKLTESEDTLLHELNQKINSCFTSSLKTQTNINIEENNKINNKEFLEMLNNSLDYIRNSKEKLFQINNDIDYSLNKLSVILENRNSLTTTLNDFNSATKTLISEEEKYIIR